jgi:serine/threonine protein kinase
MALATAAGLESSALLTDSGKDNSAEKQRQAHNLIDISLKKALKSYENCHRSGGEDEVPSLQSCITCGGLGEGSFGLVYLTEHVATKKVYALKVVSKRHIIEEQLSNMMKNERDVMMLLDSDFVVRLYRAYHDDISIYLLLELVTGGELFDVYHDGDLFCNLPVARFYFACVIMGLEHLHEKRVIYRDLKMENCLLDSTGYVKLTDMGIAKVVVGKTYTVCGTADYLAPETLRQLGHNRAVDWWACGVLLFIMCSGRSPFDAMDVQQIYKNIIKGFSKVKFPDTFPSDLVDVVKSLGRKKPEERLTMQKGGVENLRELPYFSGLDWWSLASRELPAPCVPEPLDREKIAAKKLSKEVDVSSPEISEWDGSMNCRDLGSKESAMPPEATS